MKLIQKYGSIDVFDLMSELVDKYDCRVSERTDVIYKVQNTEIYYDKILDRLYANKDLYYREIEEGDLNNVYWIDRQFSKWASKTSQ